MKIIKMNYISAKRQFIARCFVFLFFCNVSFHNVLLAQTGDSLAATEATTTEEVSEGPSLKNLSKTIAAGDEERKRLEEEARWQTIISYIQMIVGFAITVTLAWFLASWARKQEIKKAEEKRIRVEKALIKKGFTVATDEEKKAGDNSVALKPPPGHRPPKRRR